MLVSELAALIDAVNITKDTEDRVISCGFVSDLLSWVMAKGTEDCAWITVQTHMNVIAVASLHDMACIIWPEGIDRDDASAAKAEQEGIAILCTPKTAYEIAGLMYASGIPPVS